MPATALINTVPDPRLDRVKLPVGRAFSEWTIADARSVIQWLKERRLTEQGFEANRLYVEAHNHWLDGNGWVGPDGGTDMQTRTLVKLAVQRQFTPVDVIAEVLDNIANALLGTEAAVSFTPVVPAEEGSDAETAQQDEADAMREVLARWWDRRRLWELARRSEKRARSYTWGTLRAWIPQPQAATAGLLPATSSAPGTEVAPQVAQAPVESIPADEGTVPMETGLSFADALDRIQLTAPEAEQAYVYTDPDTQQQVGIFLWASGVEEFLELCWVDPATGLTHMRRVSGTTATDHEVSHDLGGRLTLVQMETDLLITEPVRMQQARLNFVESLMVRVMEQAGFPERVFKNAKPEGVWSPTAPGGAAHLDTQVVDGVTYYLIATPRTLGASITTELRGIDRRDPATGQIVGAETPDAIMFPPTDPTYAITLAKHARATILRQCKQGHMDLDDQAAPSGFARLVAKAPFIADVENNRPPLEGMLRDLLEVVIRWASLMSPEFAGFLDRFRVGVTAQVNTGPVDPEEQAAILAQVQAGVLSQQTALEYLQVEDTGAELERLRGEPQAVLTMITKQLEAMGLGGPAGLQPATVAKMVGFTDEQLKLVEADTALAEADGLPLPGQTQPGMDGQIGAPVNDGTNLGTNLGTPQAQVSGAPAVASAPVGTDPAILAALEALTAQVTALQAQVAQQATTINSPVSVNPAPVTINNGPGPGAVAPRRMVRVKRLAGGDLLGEIVTDPEQVNVASQPGGGGEGEIVGVTA